MAISLFSKTISTDKIEIIINHYNIRSSQSTNINDDITIINYC